MEKQIEGEIPDLLFIALHESGTILYIYPSLKTREHVLSSLVSAIFALEKKLAGEIEDVVKARMGDKKSFFLKKDKIIYSLIVSREYETDFKEFLSTLAEMVEEKFPGEVVGGIIKIEGDMKELTETIEEIINTYLNKTYIRKFGESREPLSFSEILKILTPDTIIKIFRALLAQKNIVIFCYDQSFALRILHTLSSLWPEEVNLLSGFHTEVLQKEENIIALTRKEKQNKLKNFKNTLFIDFSKPEGELERDRLLKKMNEIRTIEHQERRQSILQKEISSLCEVIRKIKKLISKSETKLSLEEIKKKLRDSHPQERVEYILDVLIREDSPLLNKIQTPGKPLDETFFF